MGNEKISWHDADDKCRSMSSELASLHGTDEIDAIVSSIFQFNFSWQIGLPAGANTNVLFHLFTRHQN